MRVLLAISVIYHVTTAQKIGINVPCNKELDGLLTADPDGDDRAFMSCQSVGVGNIGFWERKLCPNNMIFDFINQQCKDISKKARKPQQLNIAILNNSCAKGETCIGGSVCDLDSLKCMCPYGTIPKLDTLSCESNEPPFVSATVDGPSQFFNSLSGPNRNNGGFFPFSSNTNSPDFSPNTNGFKFNNFENQNSNNNENNNFKWNPNFSWQNGNSYNNNNNGGSGVGGANQQPINNMNGPSPSDISNSFQPNPSQAQKFVFNFNKNTLSGVSNNNNNNNPIPEIKPKITTLAPPGASCKSNEICIGGSICTLPIGICLCPGDLEARDGECVLPAASTIAVSKVGIGALCSDLAECDHGSICVMGRCTCVSPLIQHEGKCVLRQQQKVVGPGELCDNGEICGKGSVCDVMIPVCVCPSHTDLSMGECVQVTATVTHSVMTPPPTLPPVQTAPPPTRPQQVVPTLIQTPPVKQPEVVTYSPKTSATIHSFYTSPPSTQYVPKHIYTAPPQLKPSVKVNQMKIGGSKQAGVGVRCSLNTDCMIGAYCNGNTNPPSCQCLSTHVNIEGRCEKVIYPGQVGCRSDLQCHAAYTGTHCIDRICMCPEGQKAVDQTCVSASEPVTSPPGGSCSNLRECTGGSVCREGWCICPDSSMIVNKGICIQSGSKPTLPPKTIAPQINSASNTNMNAPRVTMPKSQTFVTEGPHGKKIAPGGNCGPLDSCVGNSNCIEGYCLCPVGQQPGSNGRCEKMTTTTRLTTKTTKTPASTAKVYSKPGENCAVEQICVGGSQCSVRNICECPQEKPELLNGQCSSPKKVEVVPGASCNQNSICIRGSSCESGLCRCQPGFIAVSGNCVALPMPTTPKMKTIAKPLESCENGETCNGGSSCDDDTGICMCPPGEIVFNVQCMLPPTQAPTTKKMESLSTKSTSRSPFRTDCEKDSNCAENKICVSGKCKCKPGFVDNSGRCEPLEDIDVIERPIPVSYAKHKVATFSDRLLPKEEIHLTNIEVETPTQPPAVTPARQETQKPRVVGPPIRRPKPKNKNSGGGSGSGRSGSGSRSYKTGNGNGNCPPGNDPTKDNSGKLIMCNGLEPNCPPRSYCYITSGGFATEEYNCCKSW